MERPRDAYLEPEDPPPQQGRRKSSCPFVPLLSREVHKYLRDPWAGYGGIVQVLLTALLVGVLAWHLDYDQTCLKAREAVCVLILLDYGVRGTFSNVQDREQTKKEIELTSFFARSCMNIGRAFLLSACVVLYKYTVGLHASYGDLLSVVFALTLSCSFLAMAVSQVFAYNLAVRVLAVAIVVFLVLSPYWVHVGDPLIVLDWLRWLSPFNLAYYSIMIMEFSNLKFFCTDEQLEQDRGECPFRSGEAYLDWRGVEDSFDPQGALYLQGLSYFLLCILILFGRRISCR